MTNEVLKKHFIYCSALYIISVAYITYSAIVGYMLIPRRKYDGFDGRRGVDLVSDYATGNYYFEQYSGIGMLLVSLGLVFASAGIGSILAATFSNGDEKKQLRLIGQITLVIALALFFVVRMFFL